MLTHIAMFRGHFFIPAYYIILQWDIKCHEMEKNMFGKLASYGRNHGNNNSPIEKLHIHNIV